MSKHTINCHFGLSGVVGAEVVGDYTLIASFISEVNIKQMEHAGVDELLVLVACIVLHLRIREHLFVFPPGGVHGGVTSAKSRAVKSDVGATQSHHRPGVSIHLWPRKAILKKS